MKDVKEPTQPKPLTQEQRVAEAAAAHNKKVKDYLKKAELRSKEPFTIDSLQLNQTGGVGTIVGTINGHKAIWNFMGKYIRGAQELKSNEVGYDLVIHVAAKDFMK